MDCLIYPVSGRRPWPWLSVFTDNKTIEASAPGVTGYRYNTSGVRPSLCVWTLWSQSPTNIDTQFEADNGDILWVWVWFVCSYNSMREPF